MPSVMLPVVTGLILVIGGILIGYLLWFHDRSEDELLQKNLREEADRLNRQLSKNQGLTNDLEEQLSRQQGQLAHLQKMCHDLNSANEQSQQKMVAMENDLSTHHNLLDAARSKLSEEHQRRTSAEDRLHALTQSQAESDAALESEWRTKLLSVEARLAQRKDEASQLTVANARVAEKLQLADAKIAQLESELESQKRLLLTATTNAQGLEKEYVSLESSLRSQNELLKEARGQTAAALSAKSIAEGALADSRQQCQSQQLRLEKAESIVAQYAATRERCVALETSLRSSEERLQVISSERDSAINSEKQAHEIIAGMRTQTENQQSTIRRLNNDTKQWKSRLANETQARLAIEQTFAASQQDRQTKIVALTETQNELRRQRDETERRHAASVQKIGEIEDRLNTQLQLTEAALEKTELELSKTEKDLSQTEKRLAEAEDRNDALTAEFGQHKLTNQQFREQKERAITEAESLRLELKQLQAHARANEETIRALRRERGAVLLRGRQYAEAEPRILKASFGNKTAGKSEYAGQTRVDEILGVVYTEAPEIRDDLKRISGIAEVLERRLNEYGVYTYQQIMEWDQAAIDEFSKLLTFRDRIERDNWQGQAEYLYAEKKKKRAA